MTLTVAEAEYAFQRNKDIIPLRLQRGYDPLGWLGIMLGTRKYYEFSEKYPYEEKFPELLKEIVKYFKSGAALVSWFMNIYLYKILKSAHNAILFH
jgi:hypothetical protein